MMDLVSDEYLSRVDAPISHTAHTTSSSVGSFHERRWIRLAV